MYEMQRIKNVATNPPMGLIVTIVGNVNTLSCIYYKRLLLCCSSTNYMLFIISISLFSNK